MMRKLFSLIRTDFNTTFGLSSLAYNFKNKKNRWQTIILTIAILSLLPTYIMIINGLGKMYDMYNQLGQKSMFLLTGFLSSQLIVFIFGLLYVMSKYYFSNDLAHLVPLPIKPSHIIGSKFVTLMISEYLTSLPIILPFIIIYGLKGSEGTLYWIYSILLITCLPIIPLVLASILIMVFMKYTNIGARKDLMRVIGGVLFIFIMIYFQFKVQSIAQKSIVQGGDFLLNLISDSNLLVKKLGLGFPPAMWAAMSLGNYTNLTGVLNLVSFIGVGLVSISIMIYLSESIFFEGLIGNIEVSASKGKKSSKAIKMKTIKVSKPYIALAKKELIMLFKTPIYLINAVGVVILLPILLIMPTVVSSGDESLKALINMIELNPQWISLFGIGFIAALGTLNSIGSTTFSREGKNFWIQRTLPIKAEDQIIGRVLSSLGIQLLGVIILCISLSFIVKLNLTSILLITVLGLLGSIPLTQIGMVIDIIRPLLDWDNPQKAMKQNLNVLIGMGLGTLYAGGIVFLVIKILKKIDVYIIYFLLAGIFSISSVILFYVLKKLITKQFEVLE